MIELSLFNIPLNNKATNYKDEILLVNIFYIVLNKTKYIVWFYKNYNIECYFVLLFLIKVPNSRDNVYSRRLSACYP